MQIPPVTDETFHELVRENTDPVIVMFTGSWCQPCKAFLPTIEAYAQSMGDDITFLIGDIEEMEKTASDLSIRSVPSLALFSDGMIRDILTGTHSKEELRLWVSENI